MGQPQVDVVVVRTHPRLPELGGMTEAGFNRVVAMITHVTFTRRVPFELELWSNEPARARDEWSEWKASLPKTRNKKQRKAAVKGGA